VERIQRAWLYYTLLKRKGHGFLDETKNLNQAITRISLHSETGKEEHPRRIYACA
jgi:hypothetical protein